jgi:hypothetical protein
VCRLCLSEVEDLRNFIQQSGAEQPRLFVLAPRKPAWRVPLAVAATILVVTGATWIALHGPERVGRHIDAVSFVPAEPPLTEAEQHLTHQAMVTGTLERPPIIGRLSAASAMLLGAAPPTNPFDLISPAGTVVVSDRPVFRWSPWKQGAMYQVSVFDENLEKIAESPLVSSAEWQPVDQLPRGRVLLWQVTASAGGETVHAPVPPAPEARFQVLGSEESAQLEVARRAHPANHLLLAVLLAKAGVVEEAQRELDFLANSNPNLAARLVASLKAAPVEPKTPR